MKETIPTYGGWYPDTETGGSKYWDGSRWTGDKRPPRRSFAPVAAHRQWGIGLVVFGVIGIIMSPGQFSEGTSTMSSIGEVFKTLLIGLVFLGIGLYLLRGQGPTTKAVVARVEAENRRRSMQPAPYVVQPAVPYGTGHLPTQNYVDGAAAAQVNAIANPQTAQALLNLHKLLYTKTITDAEYQAAKDKLLGPTVTVDPYMQIAKLAELYQAGILGDAEFAAAKVKALGL